MNRNFTLALAFLFSSLVSFSQVRLTISITDSESNSTLPGASVIVHSTNDVLTTNESGLASISIQPGNIDLEVRLIGYESLRQNLLVSSDTSIVIALESKDEHLEEIVISTTRTSRTFEDIPTRVEFISGEELEEKANMKPGDIRMLLSESTGIQTQQTSATSANASIRIQGLDGRYTQILKDGFPLYSGFSGGLGLLQTPPLDLKQVEVVKGSSSTLYGGGAIAGLVNLISRTPGDSPELRFFANATTAKGLDLNGFYGQKFGRAGVTVYAARNSSEAYDPSDIGLSAIPEFQRYTFNPRVFFPIGQKTNATVGLSYTTEDRLGGDMKVIEGKSDDVHEFFERNNTDRYSTQLSIVHQLSTYSTLNFKNSLNLFKRKITLPGYQFQGDQDGTFTELNYLHVHDRHEWIVGLNLVTDRFNEVGDFSNERDYTQTTTGLFVQNTWQATDKFSVEAGVRGDYVVDYGFVLLPRVSFLFKPTESFSSRIGGGLGYKPPTIFTEESERFQFRDVVGINDSQDLEKSYGGNADFNYKVALTDDLTISWNQLFFYTQINDPLLLMPIGDELRFYNADGHIDTKGIETNLKFEFSDFKLFLGYTLTDTKLHDGAQSFRNPLTPLHRLNNVLMYEVEEKWKVGLEAYYFGEQKLSDGSTGQSYWICGFMAERLWERFSLLINFENFLDARQTRFDNIYTGSITQPFFRDIYAPLDGFVINGGIKINLSL